MGPYVVPALLCLFVSTPLLGAGLTEPAQDYIMLLDGSQDRANTSIVMAERCDISTLSQPKALRGVRARHVQMWHSIPTTLPEDQNNENPPEEGYVQPDPAEQAIVIFDPNLLPPPADSECLEVAHRDQGIAVSPAFSGKFNWAMVSSALG